MQIFLAI